VFHSTGRRPGSQSRWVPSRGGAGYTPTGQTKGWAVSVHSRRFLAMPDNPRYAMQAWLATVSVVVGFLFTWLAFALVITLASLTLGLAVTVVLLPVVLTGLTWACRAATTAQRHRFEAYLGAKIATPRLGPAGTGLRRWLGVTTGRELTYHLLVAPWVSSLAFAFVVTFWGGGLMALAAGFTGVPLFAMAGLVLLGLAPFVSMAAARAELSIARALLEPGREELEQRIDVLTQSRAGVVDAADTERRRIERDLHDGAQQRLVSLAMNLGASRTAMKDKPGPELDAIIAAHEEAKQALTEMRDFVRGLHPAVLDDRGLDAALSGLAVRSPVPVSLSVFVDERPSRTVEAVAYFVVSEALTNIAKHANARQVDLLVQRQGDELTVLIQDNGRGGADASRGTGLQGLADRVASIDGHLLLSSPPGGPTRITVELPCES
jgi:signal transduction histidine kinase